MSQSSSDELHKSSSSDRLTLSFEGERITACDPKHKAAEMGDKVAFTAVAEHGGNVGPKPEDTTLVFNTIVTNIGGGYDETSGVFTAPVPGLYCFTFSYHGGRKKKTGLQLIKGCQLIVQSGDDFEKNANTTDNAGNSALLQLEKCDQVFVRLPAGRQVWATENYTSFSGFLVSRDPECDYS